MSPVRLLPGRAAASLPTETSRARTAVDRSTPPVPPAPRSLSGLGSRASRVTMLVVWVAFGVAAFGSGDLDPLTGTVAMVTLLPAIWWVTADVPEPLTRSQSWRVLAPSMLSAILLGAGPAAPATFWLAALVGYQFSFVVIRGRARLGWSTFVLTWAILIVVAAARGGIGDLATAALGSGGAVLWAPSSLVAATAWRMLLRHAERSIELSQAEIARAAAARAAAEQRARTRAERLGVAAREAGDLLERAAAGVVEPGDAARAGLVEARLRDQLRAPRLAVPPLVGATTAARSRGCVVLLLDDDPSGPPLTPSATSAVLAAVQEAPDGARVIVRLTPADRPGVGTVLVQRGDDVERLALG